MYYFDGDENMQRCKFTLLPGVHQKFILQMVPFEDSFRIQLRNLIEYT